MKDDKGHGRAERKLPPGTTAEYAGRDHLGRTYTQAIRDYDRFRKQNPVFPDSEDYRTDKTPRALRSLNGSFDPRYEGEGN